MNKAFEKILERLEEDARFYNSASDVDQNIRSGLMIAKEDVHEVAEEYNNGWIPVECRLPEHNIDVEVTLANGQRHICWYSGLRQKWIDAISDDESELNVIAWKELSEPYQKGD